MSTKNLPLLLCLCLLIAAAGCEECNKSQAPQHFEQLTPIAQAPEHFQQLTPVAPTGNTSSKVFMCDACPIIRLDSTIPAQVQAKSEFEYTLKITNLTNEILTDVIVSDVLSSNFQSLRSNPAPTMTQNKIAWSFPRIGPGESVDIVGIGMALAAGEVLDYIDVTYTSPAKLRSIALAPKLVITKSAPAEISACAPILYIFKIENIGNGTAKNVRLYDQLPAGLTTPEGASIVDMPIGDLPGGANRTISLTLKANRTGNYINNAVAIADGEITAESGEVSTVVKKPMLTITTSAPETDYVNMELPYTVTVTNTGDWPAINTVIENIVPQGLAFVSASQGSNFTDGRILWKLDRLAPGQSVTTNATLLPAVVGNIDNTFRVSAECCDTVSATARTEIKGAPGILLEVIDTTDPIKVGNTTTYRIVATNQGSIPITNIKIVATLETSMNYVSSVGATKSIFNQDGTVTFEPLTWLAPRTQAIWEVTVRAASQGDVRFKAEMTGDQLVSPVMETESTHFFE
ncbi:MAG: hypothetical protein ABFD79_05250 [Phycisphaerales bacterium]